MFNQPQKFKKVDTMPSFNRGGGRQQEVFQQKLRQQLEAERARTQEQQDKQKMRENSLVEDSVPGENQCVDSSCHPALNDIEVEGEGGSAALAETVQHIQQDGVAKPLEAHQGLYTGSVIVSVDPAALDGEIQSKLQAMREAAAYENEQPEPPPLQRPEPQPVVPAAKKAAERRRLLEAQIEANQAQSRRARQGTGRGTKAGPVKTVQSQHDKPTAEVAPGDTVQADAACVPLYQLQQQQFILLLVQAERSYRITAAGTAFCQAAALLAAQLGRLRALRTRQIVGERTRPLIQRLNEAAHRNCDVLSGLPGDYLVDKAQAYCDLNNYFGAPRLDGVRLGGEDGCARLLAECQGLLDRFGRSDVTAGSGAYAAVSQQGDAVQNVQRMIAEIQGAQYELASLRYGSVG